MSTFWAGDASLGFRGHMVFELISRAGASTSLQGCLESSHLKTQESTTLPDFQQSAPWPELNLESFKLK